MPTYDYACKECGHRFEAFQSMSDAALITCPKCAQETLQRLIGAGAGLLFKGSGYYQTDYKKSSAPPTDNETSEKAESTRTNGNNTTAKATTTESPPAKESGGGSTKRNTSDSDS